MTLKDEFTAAAVEIFNEFEDILVTAVFIQQSSSYVAGGDLINVPKEYSNIRLLKVKQRTTLSLATDVPKDSIEYLLLVSELSVSPKVKDSLRINGIVKPILAVEYDPADVTASLFIGSDSRLEN